MRPPTYGAAMEGRLSGRRVVGIVVLVAVLLATAGVGGAVLLADDDTETGGGGIDDGGGGRIVELAGVPLLAGAYRASGPLADGLEVPGGTVLLGDVLYDDALYLYDNVAIEGWTAGFLVVGDLDGVVADIARQAADLGLGTPVDEDRRAGCSPQPWLSGTVECSASWESPAQLLRADVLRGTTDGGRPVSVLWLTSERRGRPDAGVPEEQDLGMPEEPLPDGWPEPPGPGDGLGDGIVEPDGGVVSLRVPDGARAVMSAWPTGGISTNYDAVLAVDGDLDAVLDDLAAQIERRVEGPAQRRSGTVDGHEVRSVYGSQAGGDSYDIHAVTLDGRSWVRVSTGYD